MISFWTAYFLISFLIALLFGRWMSHRDRELPESDDIPLVLLTMVLTLIAPALVFYGIYKLFAKFLRFVYYHNNGYNES